MVKIPPRTELFFSTDIETNGPIPGPYSMLSFASVALTKEGERLGTFEANLETLPGASEHPETMNFWAGEPEAYKATRQNVQKPEKALMDYVRWVDSFAPKAPIFVGYPAGFDFTFMYWYMINFTGRSPFSFSALDMKSYACAVLGTPFRETTKRNMPRAWFSDEKHTHVALQDAIEQGDIFLSMWNHGRKSL